MSKSSIQQLELKIDGQDASSLAPYRALLRERISSISEYRVQFQGGSELKSEDILFKKATIKITLDGRDKSFHGLVKSFSLLGVGQQGNIHYSVEICPQLFLLGLGEAHDIYGTSGQVDVLDIIKSELTHDQAKSPNKTQSKGRVGGNYAEFRTQGSYPKRDFVVQYAESDLSFLSRLMEKYGIFYFFEQGEGGEKLIFGDSPSCFPPSRDDTQLTFRRASGSISESMNISSFAKRDVAKPAKVYLQDYNWRNPDASLMLDVDVSGPGQGSIYGYGHHFLDKSEGQALAKVIAEAEYCHAHYFEGESDCIFLGAGQQFSQSEHPVSQFNGDFTVTEIVHEISLANSSLDAFEEMDFQTSYQNRFVCIEAKTPFKNLAKTPIPKIHGFVYGVVDGDGDGKRAEINDYGQYKVRLYFDLRDEKPASASCYVRKSEVYGGADMGMHYPLLKGTEVLVGFSHGDVDRPIIVGVMPNSKLKSVVIGGNKTSNVIKSASGITVTMFDGDG